MANETQFSEIFKGLLFTKIFRTFRIAIQPSKLIIAFLAVALLYGLGWFMDLSKTVVAHPQFRPEEIISYPSTSLSIYRGGGLIGEVSKEQIIGLGAMSKYPTELQRYLDDPKEVKSFIENYKDGGKRVGVAYTLWHFCSARFNDAVFSLCELRFGSFAVQLALAVRALQWAFMHHLLYSVIYFIVALAVISVAGGSICRIATLQFARNERLGLSEALRFSSKWKNFTSFFTAPLIPVGIIILFGLFVFLLGVVGNIPWAGELIVSICLIIALIAGALITLVLIGALAGVNLMFPAVAYEVSDGFDAISRSLSYVYARPWRMAFYTGIAAFYGAICYLFVRFFMFLLLAVTHQFLALGLRVNSSAGGLGKLVAIWPSPSFVNLLGSSESAALNWSESFSTFLVRLVLLIIIGVVVSFVISFYFSANTVIYSLMRKLVDNTALDEIYTDTSSPAGQQSNEPLAELENQSQIQDESKPEVQQ